MPQMESLHLLRESRTRQLVLTFLSCMNGNHLRIRKHTKVASTIESKFSGMANWMLWLHNYFQKHSTARTSQNPDHIDFFSQHMMCNCLVYSHSYSLCGRRVSEWEAYSVVGSWELVKSDVAELINWDRESNIWWAHLTRGTKKSPL